MALHQGAAGIGEFVIDEFAFYGGDEAVVAVGNREYHHALLDAVEIDVYCFRIGFLRRTVFLRVFQFDGNGIILRVENGWRCFLQEMAASWVLLP